MAAQPIEWVFSGGSGQSIGDILKDSLEESGLEVKRDAKKTASSFDARPLRSARDSPRPRRRRRKRKKRNPWTSPAPP
jgi:hypothetical protein